MWEKLKNYLDSSEFGSLSGRDQEALVTALLLTKFADGSITLEESNNIDEQVEQMEWKSETPLRIFLSQTTAKVRSVIHDHDKIAELLEELFNQVSDKRAAQRIYDACLELAQIDNEFHTKEQALLDSMKRQFGASQ